MNEEKFSKIPFYIGWTMWQYWTFWKSLKGVFSFGDGAHICFLQYVPNGKHSSTHTVYLKLKTMAIREKTNNKLPAHHHPTETLVLQVFSEPPNQSWTSYFWNSFAWDYKLLLKNESQHTALFTHWMKFPGYKFVLFVYLRFCFLLFKYSNPLSTLTST